MVMLVADSLIFYRQMHILQFVDVTYHNRVRSLSFVHRAACSHIFSQEGHELPPLIRVGHFVGDRQIQFTILGQNDKWRTILRARLQTLHAQLSRGRFEILNGTCNISNQAFNGHLRLTRGSLSLFLRIHLR